jgi:hypothetical protein
MAIIVEQGRNMLLLIQELLVLARCFSHFFYFSSNQIPTYTFFFKPFFPFERRL